TICDRDESGRVGEIVIKPYVRIGVGARVVGPCRIGRGATLLAGSVVRGDVAPGAVVEPEARKAAPPLRFRTQPPPPREPASTALHGASRVAVRPAPRPVTRLLHAVVAADFTANELAEHLAD